MNPMRARRPKFHGEKFLQFRCTECGNCCSDTIVPITHEDVARMMKGTGLKALDIATFYTSADFDDGGEGLQFINLTGGRRTLGLRKRFDKENDRDSCAFFKGDRCSTYEHRPVTCRVWPFTLRFDASGKRVSHLSINPALPCPYELDGKNSLPEVVANWRWDDRQDDSWGSTVAEWNRTRTEGTEEEFLKFCGLL